MKYITPALLLVVVWLFNDPLEASSWRVEQDGSGDFETIQPAVDVAASGDTILIGPGEYKDLIRDPGTSILNLAYWSEPKDLTFIGEDVETVILGPDFYYVETYGPAGISYIGSTSNRVVVKSLSFRNLRTAVHGHQSDGDVSGCRFLVGETGVKFTSFDVSNVENCSFGGYDNAITFIDGSEVSVRECELQKGLIYLGNISDGNIESTNSNGWPLASCFNSTGTITRCNILNSESGSGVSVSGNSNIMISDCFIEGGQICVSVRNPGSVVVMENCYLKYASTTLISAHDFATVRATGCDLNPDFLKYYVYAYGYETNLFDFEVDLSGNHWMRSGNNTEIIDQYIWDANDDPNEKVFVNYLPLEEEPLPTEVESWGSVKALYR